MSIIRSPLPTTLEEITQAHQSVQLMLYKLSHRFSHAYGIEFDEVLSEANLSCLKAFKTFKPDRGMKISSYVHFYVTCDLRTMVAKYKARPEFLPVNEEVCGKEDPSTFVHDVMAMVSEESQYVIGLVLQAPGEFGLLMKLKNTRNPRAAKSTLREHLEDQGWTQLQIATAFEEISKACSN